MSSIDMMYEDCCNDICAQYCNQYPLDRRQIASELHEAVRKRIRFENGILSRREQYPFPSKLTPYMVAKLIKGLDHVALINRTTTPQNNRDSLEGLYLAAYEDDKTNPRFGLYSMKKIESLARAYRFDLSETEMREVYAHLRYLCSDEIRELTRDDNLVAVNNGIFNLKTQQLNDFNADSVFLVKTQIDYVYNATNPILKDPEGNDWDVVSWIAEIANHEPELERLLWEVISAAVRPTHCFDKVVYFFSPQGANGKSTFAEMLKALIPYASINLSQLSKNFGLSGLDSPVGLIISDENSVDQELKNLTNIKALATHDTVTVECKYKNAYQMNYMGLLVQTVNSIPKVKDNSNSFLRRLMIVPFKRSYQGKENRLIKKEYVHRKEVLEFVLNQALKLDFDAFHVPAQCEIMNEEFMDTNNDVYAFFKDVNEQLSWDLVPNDFLFQVYVGWMNKYMPGESKKGKNKFLEELRNILGKFEDWEIISNRYPTAGCRFGYEPLIAEYNLYKDWGDESMVGDNKVAACRPINIPTSVGGIRRKTRQKSGNALPDKGNPFSDSWSDTEKKTSDDSVDGESPRD